MLELKYDALYKEIYEERRKIIMGEIPPAEALVAEYEQRALELDDEDYKNLEVSTVEVKDI